MPAGREIKKIKVEKEHLSVNRSLRGGGGGKEGGDASQLFLKRAKIQKSRLRERCFWLFCGRREGEKNGYMSGLPIIINIGTKLVFHI